MFSVFFRKVGFLEFMSQMDLSPTKYHHPSEIFWRFPGAQIVPENDAFLVRIHCQIAGFSNFSSPCTKPLLPEFPALEI
jgi:hypothetical protein